MLNYKIKIGLAPMRRDVTPRPGIFNWEKAEERGRAAVKYIEEHYADEHVSFVDLKGINPVDVMYCDADAEKVIERFKAEKVDAVLIINGNFGNEEIAAEVARGVGKPVATLLLNENATVTIAHSRTRNLGEIARTADIIIAAVGKPKIITGDMVKPGAILIDVGINRGADGKLCGDIEFDSAEPVAGWITPVPGGVGPMTIAMLIRNTLDCYLNHVK